MLHKYSMKKFLGDQGLFFGIGVVVIAYILFVFRRKMWFGLLLDAIILLSLCLFCRRLVALPLDMLIKAKTREMRFAAKVGTHELQYFRGYRCFEWEFKDESGHTLRLLVPEATNQTAITQPKKDRLVRISYYKLSKMLLSWEIIE